MPKHKNIRIGHYFYKKQIENKIENKIKIIKKTNKK